MESRLASVSFITVSVTEDGKKIHEMQGASFSKLDAQQKSSIKKYLERLSR